MADRNGYIGRSPGDSAVVIARQSFSPTGIQTNFTFSSGYTVGYIDLYLNGARLVEGQDFTATDGSVVGLTTNAVDGDVLELVAYKAFNAANVSAATGDFSVGGNLSVVGYATANTYYGDGSNLTGITAGYWEKTDAGINTTSSVGIGTTNPQDTLDVANAVPQIRLTDLSDGSYGQIRANGGNLILRADEGNTVASSVILAEIDGDEKLRVTSAGLLGIGTDNPTNLLHLSSDNPIPLKLERTTNADSYISYKSTTDEWTAGLDVSEGFVIANGSVITSNPRLIIDSSGDVGIGTATVRNSLKLDVEGSIGATAGSTANVSFANFDDPNTGIYFPAADQLGLVVGGSRKLFINSSGVTLNNGDLTLNGQSITGSGGINITGVATATSFSGDGSNLTGVGGELDVTSSLFI